MRKCIIKSATAFRNLFTTSPSGRNTWYKKHLNEHILKHLLKKVLSGISEDGGRCSGLVFFLQQHYTGLIQISWIWYQNIFSTSVTLTNISFCIWLYKVSLTASLGGCLCALWFLFRAQTENCDRRTLRNKWKWMKSLTLWLHSCLSSTSTGGITWKQPKFLSLLISVGRATVLRGQKEKPPWVYTAAHQLWLPHAVSEQAVTASQVALRPPLAKPAWTARTHTLPWYRYKRDLLDCVKKQRGWRCALELRVLWYHLAVKESF